MYLEHDGSCQNADTLEAVGDARGYTPQSVKVKADGDVGGRVNETNPKTFRERGKKSYNCTQCYFIISIIMHYLQIV